MKIKKIIRTASFLLTVLMFFSLFTGCKMEPRQEGAPTEKEEIVKEEAPEEVSIENEKFTMMCASAWIESWSDYLDENDPSEYEDDLEKVSYVIWRDALEKYKFTAESIILPYTELYERLVAGEMAGQPVADCWSYFTGWYAAGNAMTAMKEGYFAAVDEYLDVDRHCFSPFYKPLFNYNGKHYGVAYNPPYIPNYLITFANKTLLEEAGLDPKEIQADALAGNFTYEKLREYAGKIAKDTNDDGVIDVTGFGINGNYCMEQFGLTNDAPIIKKQGNKYVSGLLDKEYVDAMNFLYDSAVEGIATLDGTACYNNFRDLKQGFIITDMMQAVNIGFGDTVGEDMMLLPAPKGPNAKTYLNLATSGIHSFFIPKSVSADRLPKVGKFLEIFCDTMTSNLEGGPIQEIDRIRETSLRDIWMSWSCRSVDDVKMYHYLDTLPKQDDFFLMMPGFNDTVLTIRGDISTLSETPTVKLSSINDLWQQALDDFYGQ